MRTPHYRHLGILTLNLLTCISLQAITTVVAITNQDWSGAGTWSLGEPGSGDTAIVNAGRSVNVTQSGELAGTLRISNNNTAGTVNMSGGSLTVTTSTQIGTGSATPGGSGVFNLSAGTLNAAQILIASQFTGTTGNLNISGGSVSFTNSTVGSLGTGKITISGTNATSISGNTINFDANGTLRFVMDGTLGAVDKLVLAGNLTMNATSILDLDFTSFASPSNVVVLIDYASTSVLTGSFGTVNWTGISPGTIVYDYDLGGGDLAVVAVVPEPSTVAILLGLAALGLVILHRRNG